MDGAALVGEASSAEIWAFSTLLLGALPLPLLSLLLLVDPSEIVSWWREKLSSDSKTSCCCWMSKEEEAPLVSVGLLQRAETVVVGEAAGGTGESSSRPAAQAVER